MEGFRNVLVPLDFSELSVPTLDLAVRVLAPDGQAILFVTDGAGRVWSTLSKKGEISLTQLPKAVSEKEALVFQALGWLAREGKISYRVDGARTFISLTK